MKNYLAKIMSFGLVAIVLALASTTSPAQDATNAPAQPTTKKHGSRPFHGKVSAIDTGAETLTVGKLTLNITSATKITNATNGVPAILSDITVGESISGSYLKDENGQLNAKSIHIGVRAGKARKKKAASSDSATNTNSVAATPN